MPLIASESILVPSVSHQHPLLLFDRFLCLFCLVTNEKITSVILFFSGNTTTICCRVNLIVSTFLSIVLLLLHRLKMKKTENKASLAPNTNNSGLEAAEVKLTACPLRGGS